MEDLRPPERKIRQAIGASVLMLGGLVVLSLFSIWMVSGSTTVTSSGGVEDTANAAALISIADTPEPTDSRVDPPISFRATRLTAADLMPDGPQIGASSARPSTTFESVARVALKPTATTQPTTTPPTTTPPTTTPPATKPASSTTEIVIPSSTIAEPTDSTVEPTSRSSVTTESTDLAAESTVTSPQTTKTTAVQPTVTNPSTTKPVAVECGGAVHANPYGDLDYRIVQRPGGTYTHNNEWNEFAYDLVAPHRTPVVATCTGVVIWAGFDPVGQPNGGWGEMVVVQDGSTSQCWLYGHFDSNSISVAAGDPVVAGTVLGMQGNTGNSLRTHLHLSLHDCNPSNTAGAGFSAPWTLQE